MFKRRLAMITKTTALVIWLILLTACENKTAQQRQEYEQVENSNGTMTGDDRQLIPEKQDHEQIENSNGAITWNDRQLIPEDIGNWTQWWWSGGDLYAPRNVLTTEEQTLMLVIKNRTGDDQEYGVREFVQVKLDGCWYTIMQELSQVETPFILSRGTDVTAEHTVDLSPLGGMLPGEYRLIEKFHHTRLKEEGYAYARFWVINPGDEPPSASETTGAAREGDIILTLESIYPARRCVTTGDTRLNMVIENQSGKDYHMRDPILERRQSGSWQEIPYAHANVGLIFGWQTGTPELFLDEPLSGGQYRIRLPMHADGTSLIEPEYEFNVLLEEEAPEPQWDTAKLILSPYDAAEQSTGITMSIKDPVMNDNNTTLEITLEAEQLYNYGEPYKMDVFLDGQWYSVPYANSSFFQPLYEFDPNNPDTRDTFSCNPIQNFGILPAGQYRIVKEFTQSDRAAEGYVVTSKEFALAEFTAVQE